MCGDEKSSLIPILAAGNAWFPTDLTQINKGKVTKVTFMDSYTPTGSEASSWNADENQKGDIKGYLVGTEVIIAGNGIGKIYANPNSGMMFYKFTSLASIDGISLLDTSNVTSMKYMFGSCGAISSLNVSEFDTKNVTDMTAMFYSCSALT